MYKIRKKLLILMAILFAAGNVLSWIFPRDDGYTPSVAAGGETASVEISYEPIFEGAAERFVAHRGYSGYAPENSAAAFELAGKMGFWGIETDISETSDGGFVCMHDETVDRTTDGDGKIGDYTLAAIEELSIDSGNYLRTTQNRKIPTFEEYLSICRRYGCVPVIEIKTIKNYDSFMEVIYNSGLAGRCIITGPIDALKEVRARNGEIPVFVIGYYPEPYSQCLEQIAGVGENRGVLYNYPQVEDYVVTALHNQNVYCGVWSIDDEATAEKYIGYGVDFIVTNELPARLNHMVNSND
ncbi:MAG: hypothetical protein IJG06_04850 [Clostridia bacterium]|nr:hypothetical protein [Clostridia bacterium]MBR0027091.1 hypothetical protein [Clostridia bacterium]